MFSSRTVDDRSSRDMITFTNTRNNLGILVPITLNNNNTIIKITRMSYAPATKIDIKLIGANNTV
jgi:hypothetical protein